VSRKIIVGDIHGCFDELMALLKQVDLKDDDWLISVGDVVDRGSKSKQVVDFLKARPNTMVLMGNHERKHLNGVLSYAQEIVKVQFGDDYTAFIDWLQTLPYYYETEDVIIVHAAFEHDLALEHQKPEVLSGATAGEQLLEKKYPAGTYWSDHYQGSKPIIYGHHVVGSIPKVKNNTYGIDTGACHGGYLTALELPGFNVHQVKAEADYWKLEQKKWQLPVLAAKEWNTMELAAIEKQLHKLSFTEDAAVVNVLNDINRWVVDLRTQLPVIKTALDNFTQQLMQQHPDTFNIEAGKFEFKTFLYKSRSGNLKLADVEKVLNTPQKIMSVAKQLRIDPVTPFRIPLT
jgi:serine/threonine protein phosphatase 1